MPAPASTTDQLILGGFTFQPYDFSPPDRIPFGGQQALAVHKLPGGNRVVDTLGPDEDDITWSGFFFASNAMQQCLQLDALRAQGTVLTLTYAGLSRKVVIRHFKPHIRRYPHWIEYEITCVVSTNPFATAATGTTAPVSIDALIAADLGTALSASTAGSVPGIGGVPSGAPAAP